MRIRRSQLRKFIQEQVATVNDDAIKDVVMDVLSDEGGAAGLEPIEDALEDLEDDDISLPDEPIEDVVAAVAGVKRHADGDYVDTTKLEGKRLKISKRQLQRIIKEEKAKLMTERRRELPRLRQVLMDNYEMLYDEMTLSANPEDLPNVEDKIAQIIVDEFDAFLDSIGMRGKFGRTY